jgi:hypothetical protein
MRAAWAPAHDHRMAKPTERTLLGLCHAAGGELLDVVVAPRGLAVPVAEVVLHDPLDAPGTGLSAGDVVLAVGLAAHDTATGDLIRAAGPAGAAAVVVRRRGETPDSMLRTAQRAEVALLAIGPDVPWSGVYRLLYTWWTTKHTGGVPIATGGQPAELLDLADATAEAAGGPVTIEDMHGTVLAFSGGGQEVDPVRAATVLRHRAPEHMTRQLRRHGVLTRMLNTDDVVDVRLPGAPPRRAVPIRAGGTVLGLIWLAPGAGRPGAEADDVLRDAARVAALQLTRQRVHDDVAGRVRASMMTMLLDGRGEPGWALRRLGLPQDRGLVLLALTVPSTPPPRRRLDQLLDLVLVHLIDDRVYALAAVGGDRAVRLLQRTVDECLARARRSVGCDLRAGMSELLTGWEEIPRGRRDADRAVQLGEPVNRVVSIAEVHGRALIADVRDFLDGQRLSLSRQLRALLAHDRDNGTAYVATLRSFLDAESDAVPAAARLNIHVNTLRYRIRRIVEIIGVDLRDPDTRLGLELELRALGDQPDTAWRQAATVAPVGSDRTGEGTTERGGEGTADEGDDGGDRRGRHPRVLGPVATN